MSAEDLPGANAGDWPLQQPYSWKLTLPCTRAEGEAIGADTPDLAGYDPPPTIMTSEPDPARPDDWRLDVYVEHEPDDALIAAIRALVPSAAARIPVIERIEDADWVTISQCWLEPIRAGRFHVHTAARADSVPCDAIAFRIEAGRAFGTGHHETTAGCLELLDRLAIDGRVFSDVADIGTGTGLLAFAAHRLWPGARVVASDIDSIAIDVAAANMAANGIAADAIRLVIADGMGAPPLADAAPFDLLVANILAGPLIAMAPALTAAASDGAVIVLAGLLATQAGDVLAAYATHGFGLSQRIDRGDWAILALVQER